MNRGLLRPDSAEKNFVFQLFYNIVILVIPLIVSPYLTRTMGSTSLGVYTYTYSIAYYFVVFAMLGINRYGQRIIAQTRDDIIQLRKTFWSLYFIHFIASALALAAYLIYVLCICQSDRNIALVQTIYVFSATLDMTWLFYGLEKFKMVAFRNAFIKVLETVCIFIFVRSAQDLVAYTLIMSVSTCLGYAVMMPQIFAVIPPIRFSKEEVKEHIKPLFTLFAAVIAVTLYTVFDKTLLGILATKEDVAFYEYSDKIVKLPQTFISIIGTVLFPRACRSAAEKNEKELEKNFDYCLIVTSLIGFASVFGLAAVAQTFSILYYGEAFAICGSVIISMTPIILIIGFGDVIRQIYIYPLKMDSMMVKILSMNALINLVLSAVLIPYIGIYGAVLGSIGAELTGLIAEVWVCRKYLSFRHCVSHTLPYAVSGLLMYFCVRLVARQCDGTILALVIQVAVGIVVYLILTMVSSCLFDSLLREILQNAVRTIKQKLTAPENPDADI